MNICIFSGRLTKDPEMRYTQEQKAVAEIWLAVDAGYGARKTTSFLDMVAFGNTAESISKYLHKGSKIAVSSVCKQEKWKDKNGNDRSTVRFYINSWEFAESKTEGKKEPETDDFMPAEDEGLPFV